MTLAEYLQSEGLKGSQFAERLGVPASTVSRLLNGTREPRLGLLRRVFEATGGKVTPNDFVSLQQDADEPVE